MVNIPGIITDPEKDVSTERLLHNLIVKKGTVYVDPKRSQALRQIFGDTGGETANPRNCYYGNIDEISVQFDKELTACKESELWYRNNENITNSKSQYRKLVRKEEGIVDKYLNCIQQENQDQLSSETEKNAYNKFLNQLKDKVLLGRRRLVGDHMHGRIQYCTYKQPIYPGDEEWAQFNQDFQKYKKLGLLNNYLINKTQQVLNKHSEDIKSTYDFLRGLGFESKEKTALKKNAMKTGLMNDIKKLIQIGMLQPQTGHLTANDLSNVEWAIGSLRIPYRTEKRKQYKDDGFNIEKLFTTYIKESQKNEEGVVFFESLPTLIASALSDDHQLRGEVENFGIFKEFCESKGVNVEPIDDYHGDKRIVDFCIIFDILNIFKNDK